MINQSELVLEIKNYANNITLSNIRATELFRNAIVDTITNTVTIRDNGEVFVSTGDIPAMWLRDSTFQILPYLELIDKIPTINELVHGVVTQQLKYLVHDPYANAFNKEFNDEHYSDDVSNIPISPLVWERKFEIDSLCAPFFLAYKLYKTGYTKHIDSNFWDAAEVAIDIFIKEQHHEKSDYIFKRTDCSSSDTLSFCGKGSPVQYTGMVWSGFRPSDDACKYGYSIPGNCFIVVVLNQLIELLSQYKNTGDIKSKIINLRDEIELGIRRYGLLIDKSGSSYYAYEVDGLGNKLFMDDANVPSLLSLPFLGYCEENDPIYLNTRRKCLDTENPFYYSGKYLSGIGSPHTPKDYVWPISLAMEGLTTSNSKLIKEKIETIAHTDADKQQCHEGIDVNNPKSYTREWFSWSNMTYCQLVLHYTRLVQQDIARHILKED